MSFTTRIIGAPNTLEHRVFLESQGKICSFFHDIPLFADKQKNVYVSDLFDF